MTDACVRHTGGHLVPEAVEVQQPGDQDKGSGGGEQWGHRPQRRRGEADDCQHRLVSTVESADGTGARAAAASQVGSADARTPTVEASPG